MPNDEFIRELAARAWREAAEEKARQFADDVARRMGAELPAKGLRPRGRSGELRDGAGLIVKSKTQTEALEALLAACSAVTPSCGLLILRGSQATGWACAGLTSAENFKRASLDCTRVAVAAVLSSCAGRSARAADLDPAFTSLLGLDSTAEVLLVPLLVKDRAAALLLALSGCTDDLAALELLVQVAQLSLDLQGYRKLPAAQAEPQRATSGEAVPSRNLAVQSDAAFARAQPAPEPAPQRRPLAASSGPPAPDELHERGRRFAKLLVEEIKLYNQAAVNEGRAHGDLYNRLREEIDNSRAAYQKRYGESVKVDYFTQELMRILADNDPDAMGAGFPG